MFNFEKDLKELKPKYRRYAIASTFTPVENVVVQILFNVAFGKELLKNNAAMRKLGFNAPFAVGLSASEIRKCVISDLLSVATAIGEYDKTPTNYSVVFVSRTANNAVFKDFLKKYNAVAAKIKLSESKKMEKIGKLIHDCKIAKIPDRVTIDNAIKTLEAGGFIKTRPLKEAGIKSKKGYIAALTPEFYLWLREAFLAVVGK